jgi:predicted N-acetyltransferase YhbS
MRLSTEDEITVEQLIDVYRRSGIRRPVDDVQRMQKLLENANLVVSAWDGKNLIGVARCFADYGWVCYLSDLAVDRSYQKSGIGRAIVKAVRDYIGAKCQLVLLSAPETMEYYPKIGFERANHAFIIRRTEP